MRDITTSHQEITMEHENQEKRIFRKILPILIALILLPVVAAGYRALYTVIGRAAGDFFYPYLQAARIPVRYLSDKTLLFSSRTELAARVEHLSKVNAQLSAQAASAVELMRENGRLRAQLKLKVPANWLYINAQVLLRDPLRWQEHLTIDKGSSDGVVNGCAVIICDHSGTPVLAGVISSVGRHTSIVNTVYNPLLRLSARIGGKSVGFINGSGRHGTEGTVPIDYLPGNTSCMPGEAVVTTGFEHRIPGGIKIGEFSAVSQSDPVIFDTPSRSGTVRVSFDPNMLRFVTVTIPSSVGAGKR